MSSKVPLRHRSSVHSEQGRGLRQSESSFATPARGALFAFAGVLLVLAIATIDASVGQELSFGLFYLLPVAAVAWWGGLSYGVLLSIASVGAWHVVDHIHGCSNPIAFLWNDVIRFLTFAATSSLLYRLHVGIARERLLAQTDSLTGAINGWTFYERVLLEVERAGRTRSPLTLAYLDLDHFKQLNDERGHAVGDAALAHVVHTLRANLRSVDMLGRLGGDEFSLLLPDTDSDSAVLLLTRLQRLAVQEMVRKNWPITISIGAATFLNPPRDVDLMIQRVDALMYGAKKGGKNRINHEVVEDAAFSAANNPPRIEKRAAARMVCHRKARISPAGSLGRAPGFATIRNISTNGVGIYMDEEFPPQTFLAMEPFSPCGVRAMLARIIRVEPMGVGFYYGCELVVPMSEEELRRWSEPLSEPSGLLRLHDRAVPTT